MKDFETKYLETVDGLRTLRNVCVKNGYDKVVGFMDDRFPDVKKMTDAEVALSLDIYLDWLDGRKDYAPKGDYTIKDYRAWLEAFKHDKSKGDAPLFRIGNTIIRKHSSDINKFGRFTITDIAGGKYWYNDRIICDISEQGEWELIERNITKDIIEAWKDMRPASKR